VSKFTVHRPEIKKIAKSYQNVAKKNSAVISEAAILDCMSQPKLQAAMVIFVFCFIGTEE
jgi:hypothetical protein